MEQFIRRKIMDSGLIDKQPARSQDFDYTYFYIEERDVDMKKLNNM